jgi:hypothetical protein
MEGVEMKLVVDEKTEEAGGEVQMQTANGVGLDGEYVDVATEPGEVDSRHEKFRS